MNKLLLPLLGAIIYVPATGMAAAPVPADTLKLSSMRASMPRQFKSPLMIDSTDVNGRGMAVSRLLELNAKMPVKTSSAYTPGTPLPEAAAPGAVTVLEAAVDATGFVPGASLVVENAGEYVAYVDGRKVEGSFNLQPGTHTIALHVLSVPGASVAPRISIAAPGAEQKLSPREAGSRRMPTLNDFSDGTHVTGCILSPDGSMMLTTYSTVLPGGQSSGRIAVSTTGKNRRVVIPALTEWASWMPVSNKLFFTRRTDKGLSLMTLDPLTAVEQTLCESIPEGSVTISPDESFAIVTVVDHGPKEDPQIYEVLEPEDRQPGWRDRTSLLRVDFADGSVTPLTFGHAQTWLCDISDDGSKALVATRRSRLGQGRPTTVNDLLLLDLTTMKADTIVKADGFFGSACFSPDATEILVAGTPEALGGVGKNLPADRIPSMTETELFIVSAADPSSVKTITKDFDPSVQGYAWSRADGKIYLTAEDRDYYHLYSIDPKSGRIERIPESEDLVKSFSLPRKGSLMAWTGQSASNSDRAYLTDLKTGKSTLVDDPSADRLAEVEIGECKEWSFDNGRGDTIYCRYYLPADFDPSKKYPLIVNYYGGCSPTSRNFESRYPHHLYAAQGYAVLVIVPSGATGRGQEFASRHVNTAGQGPADDIVAGTKQFCAENPWIDASKIGCIGASYGGFTTQYLQTITDIFAAAISHAGISDHTSYWGEGYWGYSYSEVSMADSYPWTRKDLYVDQSPLFRADKVNTPLLFLHGDKDNNVPVGESIQMFTALKLLGKPTAFVAVADQDHHILDYEKRIKWQNTIFAWFEKYLKGDSSWWDALYPPKSL